MQQVLLTCADKSLKEAVTDMLQERHCEVCWVPSGESALKFVQRHSVDLVILHSDAADSDCCAVLEVLRSFRPEVSVILTSSQFDYWNNFMTWLADDCVVTSPGLQELGERVDALLKLSPSPAAEFETSHFAVDWE